MDKRYEVSEDSIFNFFFQAEDGIRAYKVTGVQTCALPICSDMRLTPVAERLSELLGQAVVKCDDCVGAAVATDRKSVV